MRKGKQKLPAFELPPHENALPHRRLMARLKSMTREEQKETLVLAGLCDEQGHLLPPYNGEDPPDPAKAAKRTARAKNTAAKR